MTFILNLVASEKALSAAHLAAAAQACAAAGPPVWLEPHRAADLVLAVKPAPAQIRDLRDRLARTGSIFS